MYNGTAVIAMGLGIGIILARCVVNGFNNLTN